MVMREKSSHGKTRKEHGKSRIDEKSKRSSLVPTLRVGTPSWTLRVLFGWHGRGSRGRRASKRAFPRRVLVIPENMQSRKSCFGERS
jgi:hypothetical protein